MTPNLREIATLRKHIAQELGGLPEYQKVKDRLGFIIQLGVNEILQEKIRQNPVFADRIGQLHQRKDLLFSANFMTEVMNAKFDKEIHEKVSEILATVLV